MIDGIDAAADGAVVVSGALFGGVVLGAVAALKLAMTAELSDESVTSATSVLTAGMYHVV